jgi:cytochrome b subunit of formate dehydrogenase
VWLNPPDVVRRFSLHQRVQHWAAAAIGGALLLSAAVYNLSGLAMAGRVHIHAGIAGIGLYLYHLFALVSIGIREDVPMKKIAFLPNSGELEGKYSVEERRDYLALIGWTFVLAVTGLFLRWPARLGVSGIEALSWIRVIHAGCGAAWIAHIFIGHINGRWFGASPSFRRAIISGNVPLSDAEKRSGWIRDLAGAGVLIPLPSEKMPEDLSESQRVRNLLEEGIRLAREEKYEGAEGAFSEALGYMPEYSQAMFNLGVALMKQGKKDLAVEQFRKFMETDPFNPMAQKAKELLQEIAASQGKE